MGTPKDVPDPNMVILNDTEIILPAKVLFMRKYSKSYLKNNKYKYYSKSFTLTFSITKRLRVLSSEANSIGT